jgi:hypothetical protein
VTIPFPLSDAEISFVREGIDRIHCFQYPSQFKGVRPDALEIATTTPATSYEMEVRVRSAVHAVAWTDANRPTTDAADQLRQFFTSLIAMIEQRPDYKALPPQSMGCM